MRQVGWRPWLENLSSGHHHMPLFIITVSMGSLTDSSAYELRSIWPSSSSLVPSPHHATGCLQPIAIMPQPLVLLWLDPASRRASCSDHSSRRRHPPIFSLTAWRPHPNDKAASPASTLASLAVAPLANYPAAAPPPKADCMGPHARG